MTSVHVAILHPEPAGGGPIERAVAAARARLATIHRDGFARAGADRVRIEAGPPDGRPFGERLRALADEAGDGGLVVLGSGAVPLLTDRDRRRFVETAAAGRRRALANNRYSADIVAIADARSGLATVSDLGRLAADNPLPRRLEEAAGYEVADLRHRWRLGVDIDGPLDLLLLGGHWPDGLPAPDRVRVAARLDALRVLVQDAAAELVVAGRTSPDAMAWLTRAGAARTRALVEERGLRTRRPGQRAPASVLGMILDRDGPGALGTVLARLGEGAVVDTRVLLAHRLGADERGWPSAEDRFASDLLLHERIVDPWLRELSAAAGDAPVPVLLGGHTLVGPGLRLALRARRRVATDRRP